MTMLKFNIYSSLLALCFSVGALAASAQRPSLQSAKQIIAVIDSFNTRLPAEKLFLNVDKPYYAIGDTIWFKAYLFQAATHVYSPLSGLLYVELINNSSHQVKRISVPVNIGVSFGQLPLTPGTISEGSYTLRAYTRWMQNFGEECFFQRHFIIAPVNVAPAPLPAIVALSAPTSLPAPAARQATAARGLSALLPDAPRTINTGKTDLQFMPESGWLVAGIPSRVGFKAIAENGMGLAVHGTIVDSRGKTITSFQSLYKGMGVFDLMPAEGETYAAMVRLPDGRLEHYPLPAVKKTGIVLRVNNRPDEDSLRITILLSPDMISGQVYHLLGLYRGVVCYGANFVLNKQEINGIVSKDIFPTGIAHFTLFNESGEPVNERISFIDHHDGLRIDLTTDKSSYLTRDSIPLHVQVTDSHGQPVGGSFSLAVTDDAQVKADSLLTDNIVTHMLLTADLKGFVETPGWYFYGDGPSGTGYRKEALDALLLTQGWTGYKWDRLLKYPHAPLYAAEPGLIVSGKVTNLLNRPVQDAKVVLMSTGRTELARDTTTGPDGRFAFFSFPPMDTMAFVIQARNAKGKSFGMGITMDENIPPAVPQLHGQSPVPWYADSDSTLLLYVKNNATTLQKKGPYSGQGKVLQPVIVRAGLGVKGSHNLNGPGQADQLVDEAAIEKAGKNLNLKQILIQTVKGFSIVPSPDGTEKYKLFQRDIRFVIDGLHLSRFLPEREALESLAAEDITGIEVMYKPGHIANYRSTFLSAKQQMNLGKDYAFIEITTRSGNGIFLKKTPGLTTYKPLPISWPKEFYHPRYAIRDDRNQQIDLRSTIHWQPNLVTDKQGHAETSFYSAAVPSTYTVILQGSDMDGNIGVQVMKINVSKPH